MNDKLKVMAVFGTRPEGVKMAPLVLELQKYPQQIELTVVVTGQHREMLDQILQAFSITPDFDLNIMQPGQTLSQVTCRALEGLDRIIQSVQPQLILAQGDTTTTFVSSLAAFYHKIDFGHVEAGLRSGNIWEPFPEEMNRRMTALCATMHFAPTDGAKARLLSEGIGESDIWVTGNTVIDALLKIAQKDEPVSQTELQDWVADRRLILVTAHRRENWGGPMADIALSINQVLEKIPDSVAIVAMHRNPVVRETLTNHLGNNPKVRLIEPPDYVEFIKWMKKAHIILTDSGGVQEEAPALGVPVLVLRNTTERPEGVEAGNARLVGTDPALIVSEAVQLMENDQYRRTMTTARNPYGTGNASTLIREAIFSRYNL